MNGLLFTQQVNRVGRLPVWNKVWQIPMLMMTTSGPKCLHRSMRTLSSDMRKMTSSHFWGGPMTVGRVPWGHLPGRCTMSQHSALYHGNLLPTVIRRLLGNGQVRIIFINEAMFSVWIHLGQSAPSWGHQLAKNVCLLPTCSSHQFTSENLLLIYKL